MLNLFAATNKVVFEGLNLTFNINPVAFNFMGKPVYWYGIIIATGFLLAVIYGMIRAKQFNITSDDLMDVLIYATPAAIIGARLYYVLFSLDSFTVGGKLDWLAVISVWNGGIAIYGAIIFGIITVFVVAKFKKISAWNVLDIAVLGLLIGQCIGRWGNFVNAEAYGEYILSYHPPFWAMTINNDVLPVHPIFLYESLWNLIGFIALHFYSKRRRFSGEIFFLYVAWYGLGRFFTEGLRGGDELYLFNTTIRVSQLLAALSCIAAVCLLIVFYVRGRGVVNEAAGTAAIPPEGLPAEGDDMPASTEASNGDKEALNADESKEDDDEASPPDEIKSETKPTEDNENGDNN